MIVTVITYALEIALSIFSIWYVARFNIHMLQLNTYINSEHFSWMLQNFKKQWILVFSILLGAVFLAIDTTLTRIIASLDLLLVLWVYRAYKRIFTKKPLHFTSRVKRLFACDFVISLAIFTLSILFFSCKFISGMILIIVGMQLLFVPFANLVNAPIEKGVRQHYINDAKRILKSCPNLTVVGITGSYGKTSMKFFLNSLLKTKYRVLATPESYNTPMGIVKTIRESLNSSTDIFICEMGARYVGEIKEICDIVNPDVGVITSIGPAHLATFGSLENIQKTKFELADSLQNKNGKLFLNAGSELVYNHELSRQQQGYHDNICWFSYGQSSLSDYSSQLLNITVAGSDFSISTKDGTEQDFHTQLVGEHNLSNLTGAIAVANSLGVSLKDCKVALRRIKSVPHRLEIKKTGDVVILDDAFNSNPVGSKAALDTLSMFDGIKVLITPGMVELGDDEEKYNFEFGKHAASVADWILLVGEKRCEPIFSGALDAGFHEESIKVYNSFAEAISFAYKIEHGQKQFCILIENDLPDNY